GLPIGHEGPVLEQVDAEPVDVVIARVPQILSVRAHRVEIARPVRLVTPNRRKIFRAFFPQQIDELTKRKRVKAWMVIVPAAVKPESETEEYRVAEVANHPADSPDQVVIAVGQRDEVVHRFPVADAHGERQMRYAPGLAHSLQKLANGALQKPRTRARHRRMHSFDGRIKRRIA